jgi:DNA (cytosine-5)-methyltransferase 1
MEKAIRFIDLFCGIGGFRHGLEKANQDGQQQQGVYTCVWANDIDKYACQIYRRQWNDRTLYEGDIKTVDADSIPEHDLLCAGFPCQDFSVAGKRAGIEGTRGSLFFEICRILRAKRPSYVFLENVRGLFSADDAETFGVILSALDELGYDCQWQVHNSKDFGVPQNRERVFIIGHLRNKSRPKVFPIGEADG